MRPDLHRSPIFKRKALFWLILVPLFAYFGRDGIIAQTQLDFVTQVKNAPSVVMIQRSVCCSGMELYTLSFSDGSQRIMVGIPDDGNISKSARWIPVPITPAGTSRGTAVSYEQFR
jgi:hypothetical protein